MKTNKLLLATLLACAFAPALADEIDAGSEPRVERRVEHRIVSRDGHGMTDDGPGMEPFAAMSVHQRKLVKNAPYSAEMVSERQQNLADGNQIVNKRTTLSYRDSAGRTRHEVRTPKGETLIVHIRDTEAAYILNPRTRTATKVGFDPASSGAHGERLRSRIEQLRKDGKLPGAGERIIVKRVERADGDGQVKVHEDVQVRVAPRMAGDAAAAGDMAMHIGPALAGAFGSAKWAAQATTKDLGTREFDAIKATGKMRSYEIPAGELGNRNPIVVSSETWYSPELQVTVYAKQSDPRTGDFVTRLENIVRDEPAAALFTVPSDYTVKDVMAKVSKRLERKAD